MSNPHAPIRTCVSCRKKNEKKNLIPITKLPDDTLVIGQFASGRSIYICRQETCAQKLLKLNNGFFMHALKTTVDKEDIQKKLEEIFTRKDNS